MVGNIVTNWHSRLIEQLGYHRQGSKTLPTTKRLDKTSKLQMERTLGHGDVHDNKLRVIVASNYFETWEADSVQNHEVKWKYSCNKGTTQFNIWPNFEIFLRGSWL